MYALGFPDDSVYLIYRRKKAETEMVGVFQDGLKLCLFFP